MRYGIFSDVHSNLEALEAVLAALTGDGVEGYLSPGDLVGYGADPQACIHRVQGLGARVVCGNHDGAAIGRVDVSWFNPYARAAAVWTQGVLGPAEREYLGALPLSLVEGPATLVHGTLDRPGDFDYLFDVAEAAQTLECLRTPVCFVGHTHVPVVFLEEQGRIRVVVDRVVVIPPGARAIVNPGSVGQPRDGDPRAAYAVYDDRTRTVEFKRVAYDVRATQEKILKAGLPPILAARLGQGR